MSRAQTNSEPAGAIQAIDKHSVHQICSGQVVLSLATAVKELVENGVDAGATNIDVKLKECGVELVEVSDNGKGVEEANFEALTLKHHTSKLRDFSDLIRVETFGFRGEALSSLCALSDLSVVTCHESNQVGTKLVFDHKGHVVQRTPHPRQQGTTVSLQQLFYTLPVRHKEFQRNIKKEYTKMIHVLQSYCIISTGVRITCSNQNEKGKRSTVLSTSGSQSMRDNIGAIFGPKQLQSLLPFQQVSPTENIIEEYGLKEADLPKQLFTITGFVSHGEHGVGRSATDRQFFFINNRPCDPLKVTKVVNEVYHMYNRHQYPFVALNIAVASECVDVNVTPDKRQILLQEENMFEAGVNKISLNYTRMPNTSKSASLYLLWYQLEIDTFPLECFYFAIFVCLLSAAATSDLCQVVSSNENMPQRGEAVEPVTQSPKLALNLASLKAAFSSHHKCATSGSKSNLSGLEAGSPELVIDRPSVKEEELEETSDNSHAVPEDPELQTGPCTSNEDGTVSPDAKRARKESAHFPTELKPNLDQNCSVGSSTTTVDAPVCLQRRRVPLQFSLQELEGKIRRIKDRRKQKADEELLYRRFRAKINPGENQSAEEELKKEISKDMFKEMEIIGQFNLGFIITKLNSDIFMIDQHATDEKYNFEMLQQHTVLQGQKLIVPQKLHLTAVSENILLENIEIFRKNGFEFLVEEDAQVMERVKLVSLPTSKNWTFGPGDIEELIFMLSDSPGVMCRPSRVRQMFASRSCRKSVMIGTALSVSEMKKLVVHMGEIEHPWNCPHGRPTMRHLANLDIISPD
uniref:Mismatch repair endonuclease PMS2 n=1 Tax=Scophthalmus maximus TaxID=52904 RepID=A0A8D3ADM3_SCOMX